MKPGWGDWAGPSASGISQKVQLRRDSLLKKSMEEDEEKRKQRKDSKMYNVILSDRRVKTSSKYKISEIPHPFTTREEYERSIQMPLGGTIFIAIMHFAFLKVCALDEWNASHVVKKHTMPEVLTRAGKIIQPISAPSKNKTSSTTTK